MNYFELMIEKNENIKLLQEKKQILINSINAINCLCERLQEIAQLELDNYIILDNIEKEYL